MSKKTVKTPERNRIDALPDPNFVAAVPTKTLTGVYSTTIVTRKLYGPVDDARLAKEQAEINYRAEQLHPVPKRPERIEREMNYDDDGFNRNKARRDR